MQGMRYPEKRQHRNIAQTRFDLADIRTAYTRPSGECLLREAALLPVVAEGCPKTLQRCVLWA